MPNTNLEQLIATATLLRPMLGDLVFVGGAVTTLLVSDEGAGAPRTTMDVDAIAQITSHAKYAAFGERRRALGFSEDTSEGAPLCRWVHRGTILDLMPLDEKILGFSNRWYRAALESAVTHQLRQDLEIRVVTAPYFLATKMEAFKGRGRGDFSASHDLEDLIFVVDGRSTIVEEVQTEAPPLREYFRAENHRITGDTRIHRRLAWLLATRCRESSKNWYSASTIGSGRLFLSPSRKGSIRVPPTGVVRRGVAPEIDH